MRIKFQLMLPNGARMLQIMEWVSAVNDGYADGRRYTVPATVSNLAVVMADKNCFLEKLKRRMGGYYNKYKSPGREGWQEAKSIIKNSISNNKEYFDLSKERHGHSVDLAYDEGWKEVNKKAYTYSINKRGEQLLYHHSMKFNRRIDFVNAVDRYDEETKSAWVTLPDIENVSQETFDYNIHTLPLTRISHELGEEYKKYLKGYDRKDIDEDYLNEIDSLLNGELSIDDIRSDK